jgi:DNA polymerase I
MKPQLPMRNGLPPIIPKYSYMSSDKKLFLLDAYALIYRSYYAFIKNPRYNSKGLNTSAIFGFVNTLDAVLKTEKPTHIAVVFDPDTPTFRHDMYEPYKAQREKTPEDIIKSVPWIKKLLQAYRIPVMEVPGYEADDVIGTLAVKAEKESFTVYMMTPDKDFCQLVTDRILLYKPARAGNLAEIWDTAKVNSHFEIKEPGQVIDVLAFMGDASDNIPGVPGVGEVTAKKIISRYGSVENVLASIDEFTGKLRERIVNSAPLLELSKKLVTICLDVPVSFDEALLRHREPDADELMNLFTELEFRTVAARLFPSDETPARPVPSAPVQGTLFGDTAETPSRAGERFAGIEDTVEEISGEAPGSTGMRQLKTLETVEHRYHLAADRQSRQELLERLSSVKEFCFDTETDSLNPHEAGLVGLAFSFRAHEAWYVPVPEEREEAIAILGEFSEVFEKPAIRKVGQNIKFDLLVLSCHGVVVKGALFDTMIAHYLLQPELRHNLNYMAGVYLGYAPVPIEDLIGKKGREQKSMRSVAIEIIKEYACEDADITWQLKEKLEKELESAGLLSLATDLEMPLIRVLADMEAAGFAIDTGTLKGISVQLSEQSEMIEREVYEMADATFNLASPKQLGEILFRKLKIMDKARLTRTRQFSTSEEVLDRLRDKHPVISLILEYRGLKKLLSTYVDVLPNLLNRRTGRIHTSFNQAVTATGRLSSTGPNLQNIPIREEEGRKIRQAFIARNENYLLLAADYSQIELRLMAHMSGDGGMIEAFLKNEDIHTATASRIFSVSAGEVTREMRARAKTANFGIIYGISAFGLSQRLNISREEARKLIDGYFASYPGVRGYMDRCIRDARDSGYVVTIMGRKRFLPDINSRNGTIRGNAERNAINAPIQGSAADIIKMAMNGIHRQMGERGLKTRMILQVHDELVFDVFRAELEEVRNLVVETMQSVVSLKVPLVVDTGTGNNWLEAH